jgi:UPF0755 protein
MLRNNQYRSVVVISVLLVYGLILLWQIFSQIQSLASQKHMFMFQQILIWGGQENNGNPMLRICGSFETVASKRVIHGECNSRSILLYKGNEQLWLVKTLRLNSPVKLAFNNQERIENLAGRVGSQIEADSLELL